MRCDKVACDAGIVEPFGAMPEQVVMFLKECFNDVVQIYSTKETGALGKRFRRVR
jgi:hypothetical protein